MNKLFSNMPGGKLKILLVIFCICSGGFSIYLLTDAIFRPTKNQPAFKVDQINVPKHYDRTGDEMTVPENYVDEETYQRIQGFKQYMDSLKEDKSKQYDSIIIARPGLMDSVLMLEEIYHSQKTK